MSKEYVDALWANPEAFRYLLDRGFDKDDIWRFQLGYHAGYDGIYIPYFTPTGDEFGGRVRLLHPRGAKYLPVDHFKGHLYNVADTDADHVYLTEGEFDAMILRKVGAAAVGVPGVTNFRREWAYLFEHCTTVTVCWDADDAGNRGANRVMAWIGDVCDDVRRLELAAGDDINEAYLHGRLEVDLGNAA